MFGKKATRIEWALTTNIGRRAVNEDSVLAVEEDGRYLFVVADGLGGHGMGQDAANLVTQVFENEFYLNKNSPDFLGGAFARAQELVMLAQEENNLVNQMKTTAAALYIDGVMLSYGHVGDTRVYHFKNNKLLARTYDHTVTQMLVYSGELKEEDINTHPDRSRLLYVIGDKWEKPKYEIVLLRRGARAGQGFLICTDGIWEITPNPEPPGSKDADAWLEDVVSKTREECETNEKVDNFSAIAVLMR